MREPWPHPVTAVSIHTSVFTYSVIYQTLKLLTMLHVIINEKMGRSPEISSTLLPIFFISLFALMLWAFL